MVKHSGALVWFELKTIDMLQLLCHATKHLLKRSFYAARRQSNLAERGGPFYLNTLS